MHLVWSRVFAAAPALVVALCALLGGRALTRVLASAHLSASPRELAARPTAAWRTHGKDDRAIVSRDLFCSGCAADPDSRRQETGEPTRTALPLELVSTLVCPSDGAWSMAVVRDLAARDREPRLVSGATVWSDDVAIVKVTARRLFLRNRGRLEVLDLDAATAGPTALRPTKEGESRDPLSVALERGLRCGGGRCQIDRSLMTELLASTAELATSVRIVPANRSGRPIGFTLSWLRPGGAFARLQFQRGDTILAVNGHEITTPEDALAAYHTLRSASHVSVLLDRQGASLTLDYTIR